MTAFRRTVFLLLCLSLGAGCATQQKTPPPFERKPAQEAEDGPPPPARPMDMWLYSWTDRPDATTNPPAFVTSALARSEDCLKKFAMGAKKVPKCEGDQMAAGPGLYTCDNPFTSHDYGSVAVMVRVRAQGGTFPMGTGRFTDGNGGVDRDVYSNFNYAGIVYDFRASDFNTRAVVLRKQSTVDAAASTSVSVKSASYKVMGAHEMFACTATTTFKEVAQHWGDHFEFLAQVFDFYRDPDGTNYLNGGKPNNAGFAAAIASDAVAADDATLIARVNMLKAKFSGIRESLDLKVSCAETGTTSLRSCVARRVYDSLLDNEGSPNRPTYFWKLDDLKQALLVFKVAGKRDVEARTSEELMQKMAASYADVAPKILTAYGCMLAVRGGIEKANFGMWGEDPKN